MAPQVRPLDRQPLALLGEHWEAGPAALRAERLGELPVAQRVGQPVEQRALLPLEAVVRRAAVVDRLVACSVGYSAR